MNDAMSLFDAAPVQLAAGIPDDHARTAARTGRILLRREPTAVEVAAWADVLGSGDAQRAALVLQILALPELAQLPADAKTARAYDAMLGRYDATPPHDLAHWRQRLALGDDTLDTLVKGHFAQMLDAKYRFDPSASPVDPGRALFVVCGGGGQILVFTVGANARLYLFRGAATGPWTQTDLSASLAAPANGHVQSVDVRRTPHGKIAIALAVAPRRGPATSLLYAAIDLAGDLDEAGWSDAVRTMRCYGQVANAGVVSHLELEWQHAAAGPLLLVGAMVQGIPDTYYLDLGASEVTWTQFRLPEDADEILSYAIGTYVLPGVFVLYRVGADTCLTFTAFPDQYGKKINIAFEDLPANVTSFQLSPRGASLKPDVFVAGDGIVVYRGSAGNPEKVAACTRARLVAATTSAGVEHVAYTSAETGLLVVAHGPGAPWSQPQQLASGLERVALASEAGGALAVGVTPGGAVDLLRLGAAGAPTWRSEVEQHAVWPEMPLGRAELDAAIADVAPLVYFATDEAYFSSTVEFFLSRVGFWNQITGQWCLEPGKVWDGAAHDMSAPALAILPRSPADSATHDSDYVLKIDDADQAALRPGNPQDAPFYVHAKFLPEENATDLVYWIFCPFNGAALLKLDLVGIDRRVDLAPLGEHEGDWEHFVVRIDNDTRKPTKLYLSAHDGGNWVDFDRLERDADSGRAVLYTSRHGHAFYFEGGDNLLKEKQAGTYHIGLINRCDKGQEVPLWAPGRLKLVAASFLGKDAPAEPAWLQFPWRWGRYKDFTTQDVSSVVDRIMGPLNAIPGAPAAAVLIGAILVEKHVLGDEGNSAGPGAIKFKNNWFGAE